MESYKFLLMMITPLKTHFPSIPSPSYKLKKSTEFFKEKKSRYGHFPASHRSIHHS